MGKYEFIDDEEDDSEEDDEEEYDIYQKII